MNKVNYLFMSLALSLCVGSIVEAINLYIYNRDKDKHAIWAQAQPVVSNSFDPCRHVDSHSTPTIPYGGYYALALDGNCYQHLTIVKDGKNHYVGSYGQTAGLYFMGINDSGIPVLQDKDGNSLWWVFENRFDNSTGSSQLP